MKTRFHRYGLIGIALSASLAGCGTFQPPTGAPGRMAMARPSQSYDYRVLYEFHGGGAGDGSVPESSLLALKNELYGTTAEGGK